MSLVNEQARILENAMVGSSLHLMKLYAPHIAESIRPGQFVHMKIPGINDHILRRPFSVYARDAQEGTLDILYQVVGFGSEWMTQLAAGQCPDAELIGPVGRSWQPPEYVQRALLVGGGVGAAPLFMLCESLVEQGVQTDVILGAQNINSLVCLRRYEEILDQPPSCSTDDGSFGHEGFCTPLVESALKKALAVGKPYDYVAVCGPEPLMKIVANIAKEAEIPCEVSMEKRMACGVGACLSCVVNTTSGKLRACVDGPVFDAAQVVW